MPIAYSTDLRPRIIATWQAQEGSQRQLAERFKVSLSFVQRVIRRYRQSGEQQQNLGEQPSSQLYQVLYWKR